MKKNICQIIGYFKANSNQFSMKRTILKNCSNEKYTFFLFIQSNMRNIYENNYLNNYNVLFFNNNNELQILLQKCYINYIILSIDMEHWFDCINNFNPNKIYYIGHGIINYYFNETLLTPIYKNWINAKINLVICCKKQFEIISKYKKNIYKIGTLPQFENLVIPKIDNKNNSILIIGGNSIIARESNFANLIINNILNIVKRTYEDQRIFFKMPRHMKNLMINKISNLSIINDYQLVYDFFNSEIIIVFEGGTAYLEALLSNSKVILILYSIDWDKLVVPTTANPFYYKEMKEFYNFPIDKYPNLLVAQNNNDLNNHLQLIKKTPEYFNTEKYIEDKNRFIKDSIGEYIPNVSKQLIDIIEQNECNISNQ